MFVHAASETVSSLLLLLLLGSADAQPLIKLVDVPPGGAVVSVPPCVCPPPQFPLFYDAAHGLCSPSPKLHVFKNS